MSFGAGRVRICQRSNGHYKLAWREMGSPRTTTKTTEAKALEFATRKARELDSGAGARWISPGDADALAALRKLAGTGEGAVRQLLADVEGARRWLAGDADLTTAARWFAENGPLKVQRLTVAEAITRFLAEYEKAPKPTRDTFTIELDAFGKKFPDLMLLDLDQARLEKWCFRAAQKKSGPVQAADRTKFNRVTTWSTFLNRARDWNLLGPGKHAADLIRKPTLPDEGKQIFSVDQGRELLAAASAEDLKLLTYLLIAGWIGLRPSEILRLFWEEEKGIEFGGFDWERGYLHVSARVAGKNSSERFIPLDARLVQILKMIFVASEKKSKSKVCIKRSREFLSLLARRKGICEYWPADVLRHCFCSYRIAVTKSLEQVATEADNSPAILKSNYRRPLRHEDGLAWWDLLDAIDLQTIRSREQ